MTTFVDYKPILASIASDVAKAASQNTMASNMANIHVNETKLPHITFIIRSETYLAVQYLGMHVERRLT